MRAVNFWCVLLCWCTPLLLQAAEPPRVAPTEARSPADEQKSFKLPPGFEMQLVASEPDIRKPMNLAFDARGRLWVTDSLEYPYASKTPPGRDSVKILEDFAPDGKARKITTFADGLNIPIGVLPHGDGAIVHSIPNIYYMRDTTGQGKATRRDVLVGPFGFRDTHGMVNSFSLGFDGLVYACHGFSNDSQPQGTDGSSLKMNSGNTFRFRPDGSNLQQYTWGQVNPFGMSFDPLGNIYTADCHSKPIMFLLRGGVYSSFSKPHDGLGFAPEICPHLHGSTGLCGITYYAAEQFPKEYQANLFVGNVVTNRINRDRLEMTGSSPLCKELEDFVSTDDFWFRPVDIKLGPDGALYVADFYNRIIGHYEVPLEHPGRDRERGRIWRIVYTGKGTAKPVALPPLRDFTKTTVPDLVRDLGDSNLTVRLRATQQLVERGGKEAVTLLQALFFQGQSTTHQRVHALWVLHQLQESALVQQASTQMLVQGSLEEQVHALRVAGSEDRDFERLYRKSVVASLESPNPVVQRIAVEILAHRPASSASLVTPLAMLQHLLKLKASTPPKDVQLVYLTRMALRNQLKQGDAWSALAADVSPVADVASLLEIAVLVPSEQAAAYTFTQALKTQRNRESLLKIYQQGGRWAAMPQLLKMIEEIRNNEYKPELQQALLKALQQGSQERGQALPAQANVLASEVVDTLFAADTARWNDLAIELLGAYQLTSKQPILQKQFADKAAKEPARLTAARALLTLNAKANASHLGKVLNDATEAQSLREGVCLALGSLKLPEARAELQSCLPKVSARLQSLTAQGLVNTPEGAAFLFETIKAGKASARLLLDPTIAPKLQAAKLPNYADQHAKLTQGLPTLEQAQASLLKSRAESYVKAKTDVKLGMEAFKKHCAVCHKIAGEGAAWAPQLDGIGLRGLDRLLEDMLDPSRNVDQAFRSTIYELKDGRVVTGLPIREEGKVLVVADPTGKEVRVSSDQIDKKRQTLQSLMPEKLVEQIPEADFYHLLAYLLSQKALPATPGK